MTGRLRALAPAIVTWTTIIIASAGMMLTSFSGHPMSVVDEHVHYDYALKVAQGEIPHRGSLFEDAVVQEWACGVGHEAGGLTDRCGDPGLGVDDLPSGPYTSGYGHYPTFFALANVYKLAVDAVSDAEPIDVYRSFSALCMIAALVASWFIAGAIGLARWHRAAATLLPFASASMLFMGSIINPGSTALLSGVLIAGAGIRWMQTGRGLVLLLLASTFASLLAVINSLPAIAVGIAMALVILLCRLGWEVSGRWQPKVWHVVALAATTVVPVVIWGRVISATATVSNETLFGFAALTGWGDALSGLVAELFSLHTPWLENERLDPESGVFLVLRAPAEGLPVWITILVVAALVITVFIAWRDRVRTSVVGDANHASSESVLAVAALATLVLYPPALRLSNMITFGFDSAIVSRYSTALAPLLVYLLLLVWRGRAVGATATAAGALTVVGLSFAWL